MRLVLTAALAALLATPALALDIPEGGYVISADVSELPDAVRETREALVAAASSGDLGELKAVFDKQKAPPNVSFGRPDDPIGYLRETSGDGEGLEVLAILGEILDAPYAAMDGGDGSVFYVWPYFAAMPDISELTPGQVVDAYRIMGQEKFDEMREFGGWLYWRAFIDRDGTLTAFVAGD